MSRLVIDVSGEQHQQIKALAAMQGKSIKEYVLGKVFPAKGDADELEAWDELKALLADRIADTEKNGVSGKTFDQITQEAIQKWNKS